MRVHNVFLFLVKEPCCFAAVCQIAFYYIPGHESRSFLHNFEFGYLLYAFFSYACKTLVFSKFWEMSDLTDVNWISYVSNSDTNDSPVILENSHTYVQFMFRYHKILST